MTTIDRCDVRDCSAQAYVRVGLGDAGTLDFCLHHYTLNEPALLSAGAKIVLDNRKMLSKEFALS